MIINGSFYRTPANETYSSETNQVASLATHMNKTSEETTSKPVSDKIELSPEAYAALKQHAPEALTALDLNKDNPVLDTVKEIALEKYFHFGTQYLKLPDVEDMKTSKTQDDMISALDVANRFMDALNSIEPDEIYAQVSDENQQDSGNFIEMANKYGAQALLNG